jgi:hypothetical protein
MKKFAYILILTLIVFGCKTPQIVTKTETIVKRDTVVHVQLEPVYIEKEVKVPLPYKDTVKADKTLNVKDNKVNLKRKHIEQGIIGVDVVIKDNDASLRAYLLDSSILYIHKDTVIPEGWVKLEDVVTEKTVKETIVKTEKYIPKIYKYAMRFCIILLVVVIIFGLYKFGVLGKIGFLKNIITKL